MKKNIRKWICGFVVTGLALVPTVVMVTAFAPYSLVLAYSIGVLTLSVAGVSYYLANKIVEDDKNIINNNSSNDNESILIKEKVINDYSNKNQKSKYKSLYVNNDELKKVKQRVLVKKKK